MCWLAEYDRESDTILLHPLLVNALRLVGWLALAVVLAPLMFVWLLVSDEGGRRRRR